MYAWVNVAAKGRSPPIDTITTVQGQVLTRPDAITKYVGDEWGNITETWADQLGSD